jgi:hypothetical protein
MSETTVVVSATHFDAFRRLVTFIEDVDLHAKTEEDRDLNEMVLTCLDDLLQMKR